MLRPDQLGGQHANELSHAAIHPQNASGLVMHNNKVANRVENLDPLGVRLGHPPEKAGVMQGNCGIFCDGVQQLMICLDEFAATVGDQ